MHIPSCGELIPLNMKDISTSHDCFVEGCDVRLLLSRLVRAPLPAFAAPVVPSVRPTDQTCRQHTLHLMNESEVRL